MSTLVIAAALSGALYVLLDWCLIVLEKFVIVSVSARTVQPPRICAQRISLSSNCAGGCRAKGFGSSFSFAGIWTRKIEWLRVSGTYICGLCTIYLIPHEGCKRQHWWRWSLQVHPPRCTLVCNSLSQCRSFSFLVHRLFSLLFDS